MKKLLTTILTILMVVTLLPIKSHVIIAEDKPTELVEEKKETKEESSNEQEETTFEDKKEDEEKSAEIEEEIQDEEKTSSEQEGTTVEEVLPEESASEETSETIEEEIKEEVESNEEETKEEIVEEQLDTLKAPLKVLATNKVDNIDVQVDGTLYGSEIAKFLNVDNMAATDSVVTQSGKRTILLENINNNKKIVSGDKITLGQNNSSGKYTIYIRNKGGWEEESNGTYNVRRFASIGTLTNVSVTQNGNPLEGDKAFVSNGDLVITPFDKGTCVNTTLKVNDKDVSLTSGSYTITAANFPKTIKAIASYAFNGEVVFNGVENADNYETKYDPASNKIYFKVTPQTGYYVDSIKVNEVEDKADSESWTIEKIDKKNVYGIYVSKQYELKDKFEIDVVINKEIVLYGNDNIIFNWDSEHINVPSEADLYNLLVKDSAISSDNVKIQYECYKDYYKDIDPNSKDAGTYWTQDCHLFGSQNRKNWNKLAETQKVKITYTANNNNPKFTDVSEIVELKLETDNRSKCVSFVENSNLKVSKPSPTITPDNIVSYVLEPKNNYFVSSVSIKKNDVLLDTKDYKIEYTNGNATVSFTMLNNSEDKYEVSCETSEIITLKNPINLQWPDGSSFVGKDLQECKDKVYGVAINNTVLSKSDIDIKYEVPIIEPQNLNYDPHSNSNRFGYSSTNTLHIIYKSNNNLYGDVDIEAIINFIKCTKVNFDENTNVYVGDNPITRGSYVNRGETIKVFSTPPIDDTNSQIRMGINALENSENKNSLEDSYSYTIKENDKELTFNSVYTPKNIEMVYNENAITYKYNEDETFTYIPKEGYYVKTIKVNGEDATLTYNKIDGMYGAATTGKYTSDELPTEGQYTGKFYVEAEIVSVLEKRHEDKPILNWTGDTSIPIEQIRHDIYVAATETQELDSSILQIQYEYRSNNWRVVDYENPQWGHSFGQSEETVKLSYTPESDDSKYTKAEIIITLKLKNVITFATVDNGTIKNGGINNGQMTVNVVPNNYCFVENIYIDNKLVDTKLVTYSSNGTASISVSIENEHTINADIIKAYKNNPKLPLAYNEKATTQMVYSAIINSNCIDINDLEIKYVSNEAVLPINDSLSIIEFEKNLSLEDLGDHEFGKKIGSLNKESISVIYIGDNTNKYAKVNRTKGIMARDYIELTLKRDIVKTEFVWKENETIIKVKENDSILDAILAKVELRDNNGSPIECDKSLFALNKNGVTAGTIEEVTLTYLGDIEKGYSGTSIKVKVRCDLANIEVLECENANITYTFDPVTNTLTVKAIPDEYPSSRGNLGDFLAGTTLKENAYFIDSINVIETERYLNALTDYEGTKAKTSLTIDPNKIYQIEVVALKEFEYKEENAISFVKDVHVITDENKSIYEKTIIESVIKQFNVETANDYSDFKVEFYAINSYEELNYKGTNRRFGVDLFGNAKESEHVRITYNAPDGSKYTSVAWIGEVKLQDGRYPTKVLLNGNKTNITITYGDDLKSAIVNNITVNAFDDDTYTTINSVVNNVYSGSGKNLADYIEISPENLNASLLSQDVTVKYKGDETYKYSEDTIIKVRVKRALSSLNIKGVNKTYDGANATLNINAVPNDVAKAFIVSGIDVNLNGFVSINVDTEKMYYEIPSSFEFLDYLVNMLGNRIPDEAKNGLNIIREINEGLIKGENLGLLKSKYSEDLSSFVRQKTYDAIELIVNSIVPSQLKGIYENNRIMYGKVIVNLTKDAIEKLSPESLSAYVTNLKNLLGTLNMDSEQLDTYLDMVNRTLDYLADANKIQVYVNDSAHITPVNAGIYHIFGSTVDRNYLPELTVDTFTIYSVFDGKLEWNEEIGKKVNKDTYIINIEDIDESDFGANYKYDDTKKQIVIGNIGEDNYNTQTTAKYLYFVGEALTINELENIKSIKDLNKLINDKTYVTINKPTTTGIYTELAYITGNFIELAKRTIIVDKVNTEIILDDINVTYNGKDATKQSIEDKLKNAYVIDRDTKEKIDGATFDVLYIGLENDLDFYRSREIPTNAGRYLMIAGYKGDDKYHATSTIADSIVNALNAKTIRQALEELKCPKLTIDKHKLSVVWSDKVVEELNGVTINQGKILLYDYLGQFGPDVRNYAVIDETTLISGDEVELLFITPVYKDVNNLLNPSYELRFTLKGKDAKNYYLTDMCCVDSDYGMLKYVIRKAKLKVTWKNDIKDAWLDDNGNLTYVYNGNIHYLDNKFDVEGIKDRGVFVKINKGRKEDVNLIDRPYRVNFEIVDGLGSIKKLSTNYEIVTDYLPYKIIPKPVGVIWKDTAFDVKDPGFKIPTYEIDGLVRKDKGKVKLFVYHTYENGVPVPGFMISKEGTYKAYAYGINSRNYILINTSVTYFTVCDNESIKKDVNTGISVGAITDDKLLIKGVKASINAVPTVEQVEALLSNLPNSDEEGSQLNAFKNRDDDTFMHLLLEANEVDTTSSEFSPIQQIAKEKLGNDIMQRAFFIDLNLFSMVDGVDSKEEVHYPQFEVPVTIKFDKNSEVVKNIIGNNKQYFVVRFHETAPDQFEFSQIQPTVIHDTEGNHYFSFVSDRFSTYAIYSRDIVHKDHYEIPNTGISGTGIIGGIGYICLTAFVAYALLALRKKLTK